MQKVLICLCLHVQIKAATEKVVTLKPQDLTGRQTDRQTDRGALRHIYIKTQRKIHFIKRSAGVIDAEDCIRAE